MSADGDPSTAGAETGATSGSVAGRSLTRRGWVAVAVVAVCVVLGVAFGRRALDAVALPLVLAVLAATVVTRRATPPAVDRQLPDDDHVGRGGEVTLAFDVSTPTSGTVTDTVGEGLDVEGNDRRTTIGDEPVTYRVRYGRRGVHRLGPLSVTVQDVLGLARTRFEYPRHDTVTVYPRVHELRGVTRSRLVALAGSAPDREREEFDRLREYRPGDDLRDVHWRSSAKRPADDLVVKEFLAQEEIDDVWIAVEPGAGRVDLAAEVAASLVVHLLAAGLSVDLTTPTEAGGEPLAGPRGRRRLLERLAVLREGDLGPATRDADVYVDTGPEPTVQIGDMETTPAALLGLGDEADDGDDGDDTDADAAVADGPGGADDERPTAADGGRRDRGDRR